MNSQWLVCLGSILCAGCSLLQRVQAEIRLLQEETEETSKYKYFSSLQLTLEPHFPQLPFGWHSTLFVPGWHSQPIWNEAPQEQHLWRVLPAYHVPEEAWHLEGSAVDWVWVWERAGLWRRGQRVVLPLIQRDVQSLLRLIWVLCHVSCCLFLLLLEI